MAENNDGKRKTTPSLPANYISFLHLQERWKNNEDRKRKEEEEEERRSKQQQQQQTIDLNSKKTDPVYDGESRLSGKEETTVARGEVETTREKTVSEKKTKFRKRYNSKKKKKKKKENQDDVVATKKTKEDTVECGSIAAAENHTPVAKKTSATAIDTQSEKNLSIERGEKSKTRSSNLNRLNRKPESNPRRVNLKEDDVVECGSITENHTPATAIETKSDKNLSVERGETRSVYLNRLNRKPDSNPRRVAVVDDNVECGSIRTENRMKKAIQVYRKKAVTNEDAATAIETQSEKNLSMETLKAKTRSRRNQRRDLHHCRVAVEEEEEEEEDVVETERYAPVKDMNRVYTKKGEKEAAIVGYLEKAVVIDYDVKAIETQFGDLSITRGGEEKGGIKNINARPSDCYRMKQRRDLPPPRGGRMATLVWVKKEQKDREMVK